MHAAIELPNSDGAAPPSSPGRNSAPVKHLEQAAHMKHTHSFWCSFVTSSGARVVHVLPDSLREIRAWMNSQQLLSVVSVVDS